LLFFFMALPPLRSSLFPYTTLFRSLLVVPLMSAVTKHLGFGVTASVTHEHPYPFARRMSTLDHLTDGRVGWNIVTSYLKSAAVKDRKSTRLNSSHVSISYAVFCLKK